MPQVFDTKVRQACLFLLDQRLFLFLVSLLWLAPLNPARAMVCVRVRVSVHCRHRLKRMESICAVQGIRDRAQALFKEKEAASTKPPAAAAAQ